QVDSAAIWRWLAEIVACRIARIDRGRTGGDLEIVVSRLIADDILNSYGVGDDDALIGAVREPHGKRAARDREVAKLQPACTGIVEAVWSGQLVDSHTSDPSAAVEHVERGVGRCEGGGDDGERDCDLVCPGREAAERPTGGGVADAYGGALIVSLVSGGIDICPDAGCRITGIAIVDGFGGRKSCCAEPKYSVAAGGTDELRVAQMTVLILAGLPVPIRKRREILALPGAKFATWADGVLVIVEELTCFAVGRNDNVGPRIGPEDIV